MARSRATTTPGETGTSGGGSRRRLTERQRRNIRKELSTRLEKYNVRGELKDTLPPVTLAHISFEDNVA